MAAITDGAATDEGYVPSWLYPDSTLTLRWSRPSTELDGTDDASAALAATDDATTDEEYVSSSNSVTMTHTNRRTRLGLPFKMSAMVTARCLQSSFWRRCTS